MSLRIHEDLQHAHGAEEISVAGLLQQLGKWHSIVGHWGLREKVESDNSTLPADPDGHLSPTCILDRKSTGEPARIYTRSGDTNGNHDVGGSIGMAAVTQGGIDKRREAAHPVHNFNASGKLRWQPPVTRIDCSA